MIYMRIFTMPVFHHFLKKYSEIIDVFAYLSETIWDSISSISSSSS